MYTLVSALCICTRITQDGALYVYPQKTSDAISLYVHTFDCYKIV